MINPTSRMRRLLTALLVLACAACLVLPGAAGANPAGDSLGDVRQRLDTLITGLKQKNGLGKGQLTEMRRELESISHDLGAIQDDVNNSYRQRNDNPDHHDDNHDNHHQHHPGNDWAPYDDAQVDLIPSYATFDGWRTDRKFDTRTDNDRQELSFVVTNGDYRAEWTISIADFDNPTVAVAQENDGDVVLKVKDRQLSEEFMIKNGGIGPVLFRDRGHDEHDHDQPHHYAPGPYDWIKPYNDLVKSGQLGKSPGMDWFAQQVNSDNYVVPALADLGHYVRNDLSEQPRGEIAVMQYVSSKLPKQLSIPDPRSNVSGFVFAMDKAYSLSTSNKNFTITLK